MNALWLLLHTSSDVIIAAALSQQFQQLLSMKLGSCTPQVSQGLKIIVSFKAADGCHADTKHKTGGSPRSEDFKAENAWERTTQTV